MSAPLPDNTLLCTQCGGELHPDEGRIFLTCPYCGATVYLDKAQVVFHWYLAPTLDEAQARAALARWMAGNSTVKDLDQKSQVTEVSFTYFPVWYFKRQAPGGTEEVRLEPAAATSVSELRSLNLPAGDLRKYDPGIEAQAVAPSVPLDTALTWLRTQSQGKLPGEDPGYGSALERALVHIPLYTCKYAYNGEVYTALVEAGTGGVFANIFPAKAEAPYILAGGVTALVFLSLALFPIIGAFIERNNGALLGLAVCSGAGLVAAPFLFALAVWVAAKI